jgi:hypothetical protein
MQHKQGNCIKPFSKAEEFTYDSGDPKRIIPDQRELNSLKVLKIGNNLATYKKRQ